MAKQSKNQIALQANEQALEKARNDLAKAQKVIQTLSLKIPELERAVAALTVLCTGRPKNWTMPSTETLELGGVDPEPPQVSGFSHTAPIPEGIGSIPAPRQPKPASPALPSIAREEGFS